VNRFEGDEMDDEMREFEEKLGRALERVDAPAGFADRVMERVEAEPAAAKVLPMSTRMRGRMRMYAAAAMVLMSVAVGQRAYEERQERKREQAEQQFEKAMMVTDRALEHTREQLARAGLNMGELNAVQK